VCKLLLAGGHMSWQQSRGATWHLPLAEAVREK
jgi:hypothetical protein